MCWQYFLLPALLVSKGTPPPKRICPMVRITLNPLTTHPLQCCSDALCQPFSIASSIASRPCSRVESSLFSWCAIVHSCWRRRVYNVVFCSDHSFNPISNLSKASVSMKNFHGTWSGNCVLDHALNALGIVRNAQLQGRQAGISFNM